MPWPQVPFRLAGEAEWRQPDRRKNAGMTARRSKPCMPRGHRGAGTGLELNKGRGSDNSGPLRGSLPKLIPVTGRFATCTRRVWKRIPSDPEPLLPGTDPEEMDALIQNLLITVRFIIKFIK